MHAAAKYEPMPCARPCLDGFTFQNVRLLIAVALTARLRQLAFGGCVMKTEKMHYVSNIILLFYIFINRTPSVKTKFINIQMNENMG